MIAIDMIPAELRDCPHWVNWRTETRDGKPTKPPINPRSGQHASSTDPSTWTNLDLAIRSAQSRRLPGIGWVFTEDAGITGIDLDHCRNRETGEISSWAQEIVSTLNSYSEVSPSGIGIHILIRAVLPANAKHVRAMPGGKIEIYDRERFFTMTGHHLEGTPEVIESRQSELDALYSRLFPNPTSNNGNGSHGTVSLSDRELINRAIGAENGAKFSRLWNGDTSDYDGDDSRADLALCSMLSFWTGKDAVRMDALFRQSGLYRDKWDRADYREHYQRRHRANGRYIPFGTDGKTAIR